jgi:Tfp pilus assembly protein PilF
MRWMLALAILIVLGSLACSPPKSKLEQAQDVLQRGLEAQTAGRLDEATTAYREVLELDPRNKYAFYNLGVIDQNSGRAQAAENNYRIATSIDPDFTPALFNLAILRTDAGANDEAIALYRRVIAAEPFNAAGHLNLGYALASTFGR